MISILDYLKEENIKMNLVAKNKKKAIKTLLEFNSLDKESILKEIMKREELESTGFGNGIAVPHARIDEIPSITILVGVSRKGVEFDSLDSKPANLIFLILAPKSETKLYIYILAKLIKVLEEEKNLMELVNTDTPQSFIEKFRTIEGM
ncbi:MAG: PTS sugar transporter subunit IIA [candidate division WOR-3 bacterium]|nr:PTS sugar transporter subunit IIA [candidate division WOR-3 bacterium]